MRADSRTLGALASLYLIKKDLNPLAFTISAILVGRTPLPASGKIRRPTHY
jgi:hypothetical protein